MFRQFVLGVITVFFACICVFSGMYASGHIRKHDSSLSIIQVYHDGEYKYIGVAEKVKLIDGGIKYYYSGREAILIDDSIFVLTMPEEEAIEFVRSSFNDCAKNEKRFS